MIHRTKFVFSFSFFSLLYTVLIMMIILVLQQFILIRLTFPFHKSARLLLLHFISAAGTNDVNSCC